MGVTGEVLLKNTKSVYRAGDFVEGAVKYDIDEPTEFTSVTLSLKGKGLCFWEPITPKTEYVKTEDYIDQRMDLIQDTENETVIIPAGTYEHQFCFVLPEEIPSSYKDFRCFITFFLQLEFVEQNIMSITKKFYADIQVQSDVKPRNEDKHLAYEIKKEFILSKKTITLLALLKNIFFFVGEDITVKWYIINYAEVPVVGAKIELIEFVTFKSYGNYDKQKSKTLKGLDVNYLGINRLKTEYSHMIHISTPPNIFTIYSNILRKEYKVKVTLKFPFPHKELCLEVPVVIAEKIFGSEANFE